MKISATGAILLALITTSALAADRGAFYVEGKFGGSHGDAQSIKSPVYTVSPDHFQENVFVWGGAIGYTYKPWALPLRMEIEYLYRNHYPYDTTLIDAASISTYVNTQTILGNAYFDIPFTPMVGVFFGAGGGGAVSTSYSTYHSPSYGAITEREDRASGTWMGTAGLSVTPVKWLVLDLSYRYSGLGSIQWDAIFSEMSSNNFNAQEIMLGVRVMIPDLYPGR